MSNNILVINVTGQETRVALVENGTLAELYVERQSERGLVGNIYKGRVVRVLPGMQAAFVDIGTDRAAFLYVSDVLNEHFSFDLDDGFGPDAGTESDGGNGRPTREASPRANPHRRRRGEERIEDLLTTGQSILVQVSKDPIGTKGARVTGHISLPGRHLVFMPTINHIGISRRITDESVRRHLRELVEEHRPEGSGFIVRTAAADVPEDQVRRDMTILLEQWQEVLAKRDRAPTPSLVYADLDLIPRATRDLVTGAVSRIVVDDWGQYHRILDFLQKYMPGVTCDVQRFTGIEPIFDAFGIEIEINRALQRKVWLPSGAYLVIDETEALTAIDVNTGRYVGKHDLEDTITRINLEAVDEIVYQLRLRNLGGLIILDFIDMEQQQNRDRVYQALSRALEADKARTNLLEISDFGLVEMTRKRVSESLVRKLCEPCPYCEGRGYVKSDSTVGYEVLRRLNRQAAIIDEGVEIGVKAHPSVTAFLRRYERESLRHIDWHFRHHLRFEGSDALHREDFDLVIKPLD
jgi:ribonuclease G